MKTNNQFSPFTLAILLFCAFAFASCTFDGTYPRYSSYQYSSYLSPTYTASRLSAPNVSLSVPPTVTLADTRFFEAPSIHELSSPKSLSVFSAFSDSLLMDPVVAPIYKPYVSSMDESFMSVIGQVDLSTHTSTATVQSQSLPSMSCFPPASTSLTSPSKRLTRSADLLTRPANLLSDPFLKSYAAPQESLLFEPTQMSVDTCQDIFLDSILVPVEEN